MYEATGGVPPLGRLQRWRFGFKPNRSCAKVSIGVRVPDYKTQTIEALSEKTINLRRSFQNEQCIECKVCAADREAFFYVNKVKSDFSSLTPSDKVNTGFIEIREKWFFLKISEKI